MAQDPYSNLSDKDLDNMLSKVSSGKKDPYSHLSDKDLDDLLEKSSKPPPEGNGLIEGALRAIPFAGGLAGGVVGTAGGPIGSVAGAGFGGYAGKSLENIARGLLGAPYSDSLPKAETSLGRMAAITGKNVMGGVEQAANEAGGQLLNAGIQKYGPKIAAKLSNVPEQDVKTYLNNPDAIENRISQAGEKNDISTQVDAARSNANKAINDYKAGINKDISIALKNASPNKDIDITPILNEISSAKSQINPKLNPEAISDIAQLEKRLSDFSEGTNKISKGDLNDLRTYLQERAEGQFSKPMGPGQYFTANDPAARAAKSGWRATRGLLQETTPEVGDELTKLADLRKLTKSAQPGLLKEGGNVAPFISAGRGTAAHNKGLLDKLSELTQTPINQEASELAATQSLGRTDINPLQFFSAGVLKNPQTLRALIKADRDSGGLLFGLGKYGVRGSQQAIGGLLNRDQ